MLSDERTISEGFSAESALPGYVVKRIVPVQLKEFTGMATVVYRASIGVYYILNTRNEQRDGPEVALTSSGVRFRGGCLEEILSSGIRTYTLDEMAEFLLRGRR